MTYKTALLSCLVFLSWFLTSAAFRQTSRFSVVLIQTDDLDEMSFRVAMADGRLPRISKEIVSVGTTFSNSFVSNSLCCPSRATLLTGQYPHNTGVQNNTQPKGGCVALRDDATLPVWLRAAGYKTAFVGRYLNSYGNSSAELKNCLSPMYIPPGWDDWQALVGLTVYQMYGYKINDNGLIVTSSDYQTDNLARRSVDVIRETPANQPLFLLIEPPVPHDMVPANCATNWGSIFTSVPPRRYLGTLTAMPRNGSYNEDDISDKPSMYQTLTKLTASQDACMEKLFRDRIGALRAVDDLVGNVVNALAANGRLNETILIFTSDNGFLLGQHRIMYKGWPYEESIRVPLSIRVPGVGQQTTLLMALNNDLAPTILDYAQAIATIPMDGLSLKPAIMDPQLPNWRTRFLSEFFNNGGNINAESFWDVPGSAQGFTIPQPAYNSVRALSEVYVEYANGEREYYDLVTDPFQMENDPNSPAIGKLQAWINLLKTCGNGSCQTLEKLP